MAAELVGLLLLVVSGERRPLEAIKSQKDNRPNGYPGGHNQRGAPNLAPRLAQNDSAKENEQVERRDEDNGRKLGRECQPNGNGRQPEQPPRPFVILNGPITPDQVNGREQKKGHAQVGGRQEAVGQDVGVEGQEEEREEGGKRPCPQQKRPQLPGKTRRHRRQQQRQQHDGPTSRPNQLQTMVIGLPGKHLADRQPIIRLPDRVGKWHSGAEQKLHRQTHQSVDQRRILHHAPQRPPLPKQHALQHMNNLIKGS